MTEQVVLGPEVQPHEDLYRGVTTKDWWVSEEGRCSSAAFSFPAFSVDIASLAGSPDHTLGHLPANSGLVAFNCGVARGLGFNARQELDPSQPENHAHANVYCDLAKSQRKKRAQQLATQCKLVRRPTFAN